MNLAELNQMVRGHKMRKRVGRGRGGGTGKTAGRGTKGQKARTGWGGRRQFEGGQNPLFLRLPKRGFHNVFRKEYALVNVAELNTFADGDVVDPRSLAKAGLVKKMFDGVKVLGEGALGKKLTVRAHKFSKSARDKIVAAGGQAIVIEGSEPEGTSGA